MPARTPGEPAVTVATIHDVRRATPRTRLLQLDLDGAPFRFRAGQAVMAGRLGRDTRAPYSIASPPAAARQGRIELLVGTDSAFGETGVEPLTMRGEQLALDGPIGGFGVPAAAAGAPLLLVGGGTGIAPLRSVVLDALDHRGAGPMAVVYSARSADEFAFGEELDALAQRGRLTLHRTVTRLDDPGWPGRTGRVDDAILAAAWPGEGTWCLVCGPGPFVNDVTAALARLGVHSDRVIVER
jgi:NAD(P)H-flavin reductase